MAEKYLKCQSKCNETPHSNSWILGLPDKYCLTGSRPKDKWPRRLSIRITDRLIRVGKWSLYVLAFSTTYTFVCLGRFRNKDHEYEKPHNSK